MKQLYIIILLFIVTIACNACHNNTGASDNNMALKINTFNTPISCLAPSIYDNNMYIGLEDGSIIKKKHDSYNRYSIGSKHRIYDIEDYKEGKLFVGTRDAGLKLIQLKDTAISNFYIKSKNYHYSVYSIARDSLHQILYVGTSNGFYKLDLHEEHLNHELEQVNFITGSAHVGVNKITIHKDSITIATTAGLYTSKNNPSALSFNTPLINSAVNNIIDNKARTFALLENSVQEIKGGKVISDIEINKPYFYFRNNDDEWIVENQKLTFNHNNHTLHFPFKNGISSNGKQIALIGSNFLYVACKEQLLAFALHQNPVGAGNRVIAISDKKNSDTIFFITDDAHLHYYNFKYNNPEKKTFCLKKIEGMKLNSDVVKLVEGKRGQFYLATSQKLFKIEGNKATALLDIKEALPHKKDFFNRINTIYYSTTTQQLYVGTRAYLGVLCEKQKPLLTLIPIVDNRGIKDTLDAYVVDLCERKNRLYVATLNKGLYAKKITDKKAELTLIKELSEYESCYDLIINGQSLYLNTSLGILNLKDNTLLKVKQVKSIAGIHEKNPNEGFFILYYHGLSFRRLEESKLPTPLFKDLSFKKSCIAVNGRKALLGNNSGLFVFDENRLIPIQINDSSTNGYNRYSIAIFITLILGIFISFRFYKKRTITTNKKYKKECSHHLSELEHDIAELEGQVKKLFDLLNTIDTKEEENMRRELKEKCLHFADKYHELSQLPFMKHRGRDRFNITILLFISHIDANIISRVLDVNQLSVNRHKYNTRKEIERLYDKGMNEDMVINKLYQVINSSRK